MEKTKKRSKYRIHAIVHNPPYGDNITIRYRIQRKNLFGWRSISDEIKSEDDAKRMLDELNQYNEE